MHAETAQIPAVAPRAGAGSPPAAEPLPDPRARRGVAWLVHLHWWAIVGQGVVIVAAQEVTHIGLPVGTLAGLIVLEIIGNVALRAWANRSRVTEAGIAVVMLLDVAVLTALLDLTGGVSNPFSTLYLVNVALAAVVLSPRWSWVLMAASLVAFAFLFVHEAYVGPSHHVHVALDPTRMMESHLRGMWVALALTAIFIVFFVQRVWAALAVREQELQATRAQAQRRERLASLATLAAGAAHELSTPLGTIAIVAKELQRSLPADVPREVRVDLQLVRDQVARCRDILDRMAAHAGEHAGEPLAPVTVRRWIAAALDGCPGRERVTVEVPDGDAQFVGPPRALADALRGILKNAVQASPSDTVVTLRVSVERGFIHAVVQDRGPGMPANVLARVGEPFFTTKVPGEGMGLGLFLTRALAEQLGGDFTITSRPGAGTEASIKVPAARAGGRSTL